VGLAREAAVRLEGSGFDEAAVSLGGMEVSSRDPSSAPCSGKHTLHPGRDRSGGREKNCWHQVGRCGRSWVVEERRGRKTAARAKRRSTLVSVNVHSAGIFVGLGAVGQRAQTAGIAKIFSLAGVPSAPAAPKSSNGVAANRQQRS